MCVLEYIQLQHHNKMYLNSEHVLSLIHKNQTSTITLNVDNLFAIV